MYAITGFCTGFDGRLVRKWDKSALIFISIGLATRVAEPEPYDFRKLESKLESLEVFASSNFVSAHFHWPGNLGCGAGFIRLPKARIEARIAIIIVLLIFISIGLATRVADPDP